MIRPAAAAFLVALLTAAPRCGADEVTVEDVKRFLDPTVMISRVEYRFQANHLRNDFDVYTHLLRPWYAIDGVSAAWVRLPFATISPPTGDSRSAISDITFGYGRMLHENLERRLTASAFSVELTTPTGDVDKGTSADAWIGRINGAIMANPTDLFSLFVIGRYSHSFDSIVGGGDLRTAQLEVQAFRVFPKSYFLALTPTLSYDFDLDVEVFSFVFGGGKALTRRFALAAGYVEHISGQRSFNRGFTIGLNYLYGPLKGR
jgi:hypothetical protein